MQNIVLVIHLILALALIVTVLLQRSEGGGLGIGGGGGGNTSGRPPASPVTKFTWMLASAFLVTSVSLVVLASNDASSDSVLQQAGDVAAPADTSDDPLSGDLLPPSATDGPATPPKPEE